MSSTRLEQIRQRMEDIEWIKKAIVATLQKKTENPKQKVIHDHMINNLLNMVQVRSLDVLHKTKGEALHLELKKMTMEYGAGLGGDGVAKKKRKKRKKGKKGEGKLKSKDKERGNNLMRDLDLELGEISQEVKAMQVKKNMLKPESESDPDLELTVWERLDRDLKQQRKYQKSYIPKGIQAPYHSEEFFQESAFKPPYARPNFSSDEHDGRSLDAQYLFQRYQQMSILKRKGVLFKDSLQMINHFEKIFDVALDTKMSHYRKFSDFYGEIASYLKNFFKKVQPLVNFQDVQKQIDKKFEEKKQQKTLKGYFQLTELTDKKKEETKTQRYCDVCDKYFNNDNVYVHHLKGKKHLRNEKSKKRLIEGLTDSQPITDANKNVRLTEEEKKQKKEDRKFELAYHEHSILELKNLLIDIFENTTNFLRRKQTYDRDNISEESLESENDLDLSEEEEEGTYNPKNLPIGWDGKPIPYWLFKLHGLGIEYKCEICGNYSYWGRRAFEKHFTEWRHSYGMKCLKIPNSVHFREITSINDALILHKKLLLESETTKFNPEKEEEFEDSEGNVLDKRTFIDLQKQGLL